MIPSRPSDETRSQAERKVFAWLRDQLSDDWAGLHSLGLASHPRKPWAEIDFVVIGPPGIFCLEVKGGRLERRAGEWVFIDRHGRRNTKPEGPFEQVGSAAAALRNWLCGEASWIRDVIVGYGVITPDAPFAVRGPDILREVLYDQADLPKTMASFLSEVGAYWHERLDARRHAPPRSLSSRDVDTVVELLRRDFDLVPTPSVQLTGVNRELVRLTGQQRSVVAGLADNPRVWITGGAGTGKTLLAMDEVERRAREGARVLYTCFNSRLAGRQAAGTQEFGSVCCRHLHGLMTELAGGLTGGRVSRPDVDDDYYFMEWLPDRALEAALEAEPFDVLVVDEGQDLLLPAYLDVLDALLRGGLGSGSWRWFSDPAQNIFKVSSPAAVARLGGYHPARYNLDINCRNTRPIAASAHMLSGVEYSCTVDADGPEVEYLWYRDPNDGRRQISHHLARLISGGVKPTSIVVLGRRHLDNGILQGGLESTVPYPIRETPDPDGSIEFATIGSYKGLEADVIVLIDIDGFSNADVLADIYAGATRARSFLIVALDQRYREGYAAMARRFGQAMAESRP